MLSTALWSLRSDSPRLFFLSDHELSTILSETYNDLPALQKFFEKVFPNLSNIILLDGTDLTVSKKVFFGTVVQFFLTILMSGVRFLSTKKLSLLCLFLLSGLNNQRAGNIALWFDSFLPFTGQGFKSNCRKILVAQK